MTSDMVQPPALSILLVNFNTTDHLARCLGALQELATSIPYEAIVVDNASEDGVQRIRREFPWVRLIENAENRFYAAAVNQAWHEARGRMVLLLGTDVLLRAGALEALFATIDRDDVYGAVGCRLARPGGDVEPSVRAELTPSYFMLNFTLLGWFARRWRDAVTREVEYRDFDRRSRRDVGSCTASCLMLRREFIDTLGGYGSGYRLYFVEDDICRRIRQGGQRIGFLGEHESTHLGHVSVKRAPSAKIRRIWYADARHYARTHFSRAAASIIVGLMAITESLRATRDRLSRIGLISPPRPWWNPDTM